MKSTTKKDLELLAEARRRMVTFNHTIDSGFLGLGFPSEYKSQYLTPSFARKFQEPTTGIN